MSASQEVPANSDTITDPIEALSSLARRSSERAEPRLAAVSEKPPPRMPTTEVRFDALRPAPSQNDRLETAMNEFVRRKLRPEAVPEPAGLKRDARRQAMFTGAGAVVIAAVVALVIVTLFPRQKDIIQSFAAALPTQAIPAEPAAAPGESLNHEQSEQLLQQFMQWRQNIALTAKP
jgi:hypothetical protein